MAVKAPVAVPEGNKKESVPGEGMSFGRLLVHNRDMGGGGKVGGNMGNTRVQWGGRGWLVACRGQRQVKVSEKEKQTRWMAKKDQQKKWEK